MKKNLLSVALIISLMLSVAGCGETGNTSIVDSGTTIADNNETAKKTEIAGEIADVTEETETTKKETVVEEIKVGSDKLVPDCPVNVSVDIPLGTFYRNSHPEVTEYKLSEMTGENIAYAPFKHTPNYTDVFCETDFYFKGEAFDTTGNPVYVELLKNGELFSEDSKGNMITDEEFVRDYNVKGFALTLGLQGASVEESRYFFYGDNTENFNHYTNIGLGTSRTRVEELLGEGFVGTNQEYPTVMYNNGETTMVIQYERKERIMGDETGNPIIDEAGNLVYEFIDNVYAVYLINNN